jgi:hypothetical protein
MGKRGPNAKFTQISCPNQDCQHYGKLNEGNIVGNGTYQTKSRRIVNGGAKRKVYSICEEHSCNDSNYGNSNNFQNCEKIYINKSQTINDSDL